MRSRGARGRKAVGATPSARLRAAEAGAGGEDGPGAREDADALRRRFVEAARRAEIVALVNAANSEEELGARVAGQLCDVFDAEVAFVLDDGGGRRERRVVVATGLPDQAATRLLTRGECVQSLTDGASRTLEGPNVLGIVGARAAVIAPFRATDGRAALVGVARLYDSSFDQAERATVEALTLAVGQALERIWAYESRDRSAAEQAALVRAAKSMSTSLEIDDVLQTLCHEVRRGLDCDVVAAALGDEVEGYLVAGAAGLPAEWVGFRQPPGSGFGSRAVQAGRVLVTQSYREERYAPPETSDLTDVRACVAAPLRWDGRIRGFVSAGFAGARRIAAADADLLEGFADLAGLACSNSERHAALREAADLDGLTGCMNRDALQRRLDDLVGKADRDREPLSLALLDLDGFKTINDVFGHPSGDSVLQSVGAALRAGVRGGDLVARYGGDEFAVILPGASERQAAPVLDRVRAGIRSLAVPGGRLTACVGLAEHAPGETLDELVARADDALRSAKGTPGTGLVRRAGGGMSADDHDRAERADPDRDQRWRAVAGDIGLVLARQPDAGASAAVVAEELRETLGLESCRVMQLIGEGRLELAAASGEGPPVGEVDAESGSIGVSLREKRAVLDGERAGRRGPELRSRRRGRGEAGGTELVVPVIVASRAWGVISCLAGARDLDQVDAGLVSAVAEHLAASVRAAELYEQLTESMVGTAEALATALEARDSYGTDLARSVAELAVAVGREMGLPDSAIDDLRYGAIFHDIGKVAVPESLINKPGPLSAEEFAVVKRHPVTGAEILTPVSFLYGVRTIVRHAHEHWDGSGYPEGLRRSEIPLGARIVLAVDAYRAMTSSRPYRERLSPEQAQEELREEAGRQFDPEVIEALLRVLKRRDAVAAA